MRTNSLAADLALNCRRLQNDALGQSQSCCTTPSVDEYASRSRLGDTSEEMLWAERVNTIAQWAMLDKYMTSFQEPHVQSDGMGLTVSSGMCIACLGLVNRA